MANTTTIILKNSGTSGNVPSANNLQHGEIALNFSDGILFYKNSNNEVLSISGSSGVANTVNVAFNQANVATEIAISAFTKANQQTNIAFKTVIANGTSLVADSNSDTLTILTSGNVSITADANGDNLVFDLTSTGVTSGTFGSTTSIPVISVDSKGRLTAVSTQAIDPSIASAAFDKANAQANLAFSTVIANGTTITADSNADTLTILTTGNVSITADATGDNLTFDLTTTGVNSATYGSATIVPVLVVDSRGRLTSVTNTTIDTSIATAAFNKANQQTNLAFSTVVANGISLVADSNADTLTIRTTGNVAITADAAGDNMTFDLTTTGVTAATYGNATIIPIFTVDSRGRLISVTNTAIDTSTKLNVSGGVITGDLTISGNLILSGNTTFINVQTYSVTDPLLYLAANNYISDLVDIGFVANYVNTTGSNVHTGIIRDSGTKEYYVFQGYDKEPENNHIDPNANNFTIAFLNANIRSSNIILNSINVDNWIQSSYNKANSANVIASAAFDKANAQANIAFSIIVANGTPLVADSNADTLTILTSGNVAITADATGDNVTFDLTTTGVTAATYGNSTIVPVFTVDSRGRLTSATNTTIDTSIATAAFNKANQQTNLAFSTIVANGISLVADSNADTLTIRTTGNVAITADAVGDNLTFDLTTTDVVAATYGNSTIIPVFTVDARGRLTSVTNTTIDTSIASAAFDKANSANVVASAAFDKANSANVVASAAFDKANSANVIASAAFDKANAANVIAVAAFEQANGANIIAISAYNLANIANTTISSFSPNQFSTVVNVGSSSIELQKLYFDLTTGGLFGYLNDGDTSQLIELGAGSSGSVASNTLILEIASAAFDKANSANVVASAAFDKANSANVISSAAFDKANSANVIASAAFDKANSANVIASAAFDKANSANVIASAAFDRANTKLNTSGGIITGDLTISGNLTLSGNTTLINVQTYSVTDSLIYLAANNYVSDLVDIGFVANYVNTTGSNVHTGLMRDSGTKEYYLFQGYDKEPENNHIDPNANNFTISFLNANVRSSNIILNNINVDNWIQSSYDKANSANVVASSAFDKANSANVIGANASIGFIIDGGGVAITTGQKGHLEIPFNATILQCTLLSDVSGSANIEIWKAPYAAYPPIQANTINSSGFVLTSTNKNQITSINTTTINAGDILAYNVASLSTITKLTISLKVIKT